MRNVKSWVWSDPHFGHRRICEFIRNDGSSLRPWDDVDVMNEYMIARYNSLVKPEDKCYFLGDIVINRKALVNVGRLNGDKILIKGNHDIFKLEDYTEYFRDIRAYHVVHNIIFSHIPIHPGSKGRFKANVHGHLHADFVTDVHGNIDPWYINVCVENTEYGPILMDEVYARVNKLNES